MVNSVGRIMETRGIAALVALSILTLAGFAVAIEPSEIVEDAIIAARTVPCTDAAVCGSWGSPFDGQEPAVSMALLHTGQVLYWSGVEAVHHESHEEHDHNEPYGNATFFTVTPHRADSRILDLATMTIVTPGESGGAGDDLFCAGHTILADGTVLAVGSSEWHILTEDPQTGQPAITPLEGGTDARIFVPGAGANGEGAWETVANMTHGRWYPSLIETPNGDALAASGITNLTQPHTQRGVSELFDGSSWSPVDDRPVPLPLYPRLTYLPGGPLEGELFFNTVGTMWGPFGEHPGEADWSIQQWMAADGTWNHLGPSVFGARQHASSVMLPLDPTNDYAPQFLTFGGTLQRSVAAVPFTELAALDDDNVTRAPDGTPLAVHNEMRSSMNFGRWHHNGVLLPDGSVLAVGGAAYDNVVVHGQEDPPILNAETYDPATDTWTVMAPMSVERGYHSTAILLPDGRVLVGGHVPLPVPPEQGRDADAPIVYEPQEVETRFEIFSPAYLHQDGGQRPVIDGIGSGGTGQDDARVTGQYGQSVGIGGVSVPAGWTLDGFVLVRPGATTHAFDSSQRVIAVNYALPSGPGAAVQIELPPGPHVAPPGHYMLFANAVAPSGVVVPSEAVWVHLS